MQIQFNEYRHKKGRIYNPQYSYKIKLNIEKPRITDPEKGTWEIIELTYHFVDDERVTVPVTEELRPVITEVMRLDRNRINRENKRSEDITISNIEDSDESLFADDSFFTVIKRQELKSDLEYAINQLPSKQQTVIRQRYFQDIPTSDIAQMEGVDVSAISHREKRAKENLKKILAERQLSF